jgi:hypothetical protein
LFGCFLPSISFSFSCCLFLVTVLHHVAPSYSLHLTRSTHRPINVQLRFLKPAGFALRYRLRLADPIPCNFPKCIPPKTKTACKTQAQNNNLERKPSSSLLEGGEEKICFFLSVSMSMSQYLLFCLLLLSFESLLYLYSVSAFFTYLFTFVHNQNPKKTRRN